MGLRFSLRIRDHIQTPQDKKAYNEKLFTRVAHEYDQATVLMSFGRDKAWKRRLVAELPAMSNPRCIDLACGTGDVTFLLADKYPAGRIVGIDLTESMLTVATQRSRYKNVTFQINDMCHLPHAPGSADVVTGSYALRNAPVLDDAIKEVHRVLRPGGWAAFLDFSKSTSPFLQKVNLPILKYWTGFCSILIHGAPEHAYIAESLRLFPDRVELRKKINEHGFSLQKSIPCFGGILELLFLVKR